MAVETLQPDIIVGQQSAALHQTNARRRINVGVSLQVQFMLEDEIQIS